MPSVHEIAFVSQQARRVEVYTRRADGTWLLREVGADGTLSLQAGPAETALARIYEGVELSGET